VIVCTYNGSRRLLAECFRHLKKIDYPDFEVIVVDDGSTDQFTDCARDYGFRLISNSEFRPWQCSQYRALRSDWRNRGLYRR